MASWGMSHKQSKGICSKHLVTFEDSRDHRMWLWKVEQRLLPRKKNQRVMVRSSDWGPFNFKVRCALGRSVLRPDFDAKMRVLASRDSYADGHRQVGHRQGKRASSEGAHDSHQTRMPSFIAKCVLTEMDKLDCRHYRLRCFRLGRVDRTSLGAASTRRSPAVNCSIAWSGSSARTSGMSSASLLRMAFFSTFAAGPFR